MATTYRGLALALGLLLTSGCGGGGTSGFTVAVGTYTLPAAKHLYFSQDGNANGLFEIDLATGAATLAGLGISGVTVATCGLTETPDPDVLLGSLPFGIAHTEADGSGITPIPASVTAEGLAMNIVTGVLYGSINGNFFTVDPVTGVNTGALPAPGNDIEGLAVDPVNNLVYGIGGGNGNLFVYNVGTNAWSIVGATGLNVDNSGLAYDHLAGVLYGVEPATDSLYRLDTATGAATLVGPLGTSGAGGLAFVLR